MPLSGLTPVGNAPIHSADVTKPPKHSEADFRKIYSQELHRQDQKVNAAVETTKSLVVKENGKLKLNSSHPSTAGIRKHIAETVKSEKLQQPTSNGTDLALKELASNLTAQIVSIMLRPMLENLGGATMEERLYKERLFDAQITTNGSNGFEQIRDAVYEELKASSGGFVSGTSSK